MIKFMDRLITGLFIYFVGVLEKRKRGLKPHHNGMTSCHHGDVQCQNNLAQAIRVMQKYSAIKVMEIDFVQVGDDFVSSHDYSADSIKNGAPLRKWVEQVVLKRKKILWLDLKSHIDFFAFTCCDVRFKFDCRQLFRVLAAICNETKQRLQDRLWLSCQDCEVRETLIRYNNRLKERHRWIIATDIPYVYSYACKYLLPLSAYSWIHDHVFSYFKEYDFTTTTVGVEFNKPPVVCIDHSFFPSDTKLIQFIEQSTIPPGSTILLYTFQSHDYPPIEVLGYTIIMQYDYTGPPRQLLDTNKSHSV